ncbi:MAG: hypothetical protein H6810_10775 [Phycisphaeraceae bacterium]|nr:MAG: hypothetical protein H6810_10775 [Phycisphaeraceae bacterium]
MLAIFEWAILGLGVYLGVGLLVAVAFVLVGVERVSPGSRGSGWAFRLLIIPGSAAFWPYLAALWVRPALPPPATTGDGEPFVAPADDPLDPDAETAV